MPDFFGWPQVWVVTSTDSRDVTTILAVTSTEKMATDLIQSLNLADYQDAYRYSVERKPVLR